MDPSHLRYAMEITGLSEEAIHNASKIVRQKEELKEQKRRQRQQQQQKQNQAALVMQQQVQDGMDVGSSTCDKNIGLLMQRQRNCSSTVQQSANQPTVSTRIGDNELSVDLRGGSGARDMMQGCNSNDPMQENIERRVGMVHDILGMHSNSKNNFNASNSCRGVGRSSPSIVEQAHSTKLSNNMRPISQSMYESPIQPSMFISKNSNKGEGQHPQMALHQPRLVGSTELASGIMSTIPSTPSSQRHSSTIISSCNTVTKIQYHEQQINTPSYSSTILSQAIPMIKTTSTGALKKGDMSGNTTPTIVTTGSRSDIFKSKKLPEEALVKPSLQKKELLEIASKAEVTFKREQSKWERLQKGLFFKHNLVMGRHIDESFNCILAVETIGAVTRCSDFRSALKIKTQARIKQKCLKANTRIFHRRRLCPNLIDGKEDVVLMNLSVIQAELLGHPLKVGDDLVKVEVPALASSSLQFNATASLLDVTDRYKRVKVQPRKESKLLEKNLRKYRQMIADGLTKKYKEVNKSIISHSVDFFKFHRGRKTEVSRRARSIRDYLANSLKKKIKGEEMEKKARIAALRANDMESYTTMVEDARNERLKFLLDKTDECINQISGLLKNKQQDEKSRTDGSDNNNGGDGDAAVKMEEEQSKESYYESAHVRQEDVKQPSILVGGELKDYQVGGLQWLVSLYNNKLNGILADEMGLGKTVQTIALIAHLMEQKDNKGPYLVIVPLSTLSNWVNEFRRWCPSATVVVYKGTPAQRKELFKYQIREGHFNVLLTTYEYIIKDKSSLRKLEWQYAIVDEGHRMKNAQSKFAVILGTQYTTRHRVLLTGTPLQNSLPELWSLLNFLLPTIFNSLESFDQWFNKPFAQFGTQGISEDREQSVSNEERMLIIQRLHDLLRPFMLRRVKSDVLDQLPDKVEKVLRCELSSWQKELYKQISYSVLDSDGNKKSARGLNNIVMQLRKVCNHPYMFSPEGYYITEDLIRTSGKVELLDRMLPKLKAAGHRILMFFQMTATMTIIEDYFKLRNYLSLRLDGSTAGEERERRMELFNAPNSPYFVFLLSTRAGGLGLNLVTADTVIIFDSDWNPMMDLQAQDRAHRIGQKSVVSVFRLITNSPVEEKILSRATEKLNMSEIIVEAGKFDKRGLQEEDSEERQQMMQLLLTDFDSTNTKGPATSSLPTSDDDADNEADENDDKEEVDINELLSRHDEDYEFYHKLDSGKIKSDVLHVSPGLNTDPNDIPNWIRYPNGKKEENFFKIDDSTHDEVVKRRTASHPVIYCDGLTERQFLKIVEQQAEVEEKAAEARKLEWKQKRINNAISDTSVATEEAKLPEPVTANIPKKSEKCAIKNAQPSKVMNSKDENKWGSSNFLPEELSSRLISITKCAIALKEPGTKRRLSDVFRERPCKKTYPDYYEAIDHPIAINDIMRNCRACNYSSVNAFLHDWALMFANAKKYNGKNSWIAIDASALADELQRLLNNNNITPVEQDLPRKKLRIKLSLKKLRNNKEKKRVDVIFKSLPKVHLKRKCSSSNGKGKRKQRKF